MSCCLFNARSIVNKLTELYHVLYVDNFDIVFITETWLHCGICDGLLECWIPDRVIILFVKIAKAVEVVVSVLLLNVVGTWCQSSVTMTLMTMNCLALIVLCLIVVSDVLSFTDRPLRDKMLNGI